MAVKMQKGAGKPPEAVEKPQCGVHHTPMVFAPQRGAWMCTEPGCVRIARPEQDPGGKPLMGRGPIELLQHSRDGEVYYFLRATDNNLLLDISSLVSTARVTGGIEIERASTMTEDELKENSSGLSSITLRVENAMVRLAEDD